MLIARFFVCFYFRAESGCKGTTFILNHQILACFFCVFFRVYLVHQFWVQMLTFYPRCLSGCKGTTFILNCLILGCLFAKFLEALKTLTAYAMLSGFVALSGCKGTTAFWKRLILVHLFAKNF